MDARVEPYGRTNWKRFGAIFVAGAACATALVIGISDGALASTFLVSGQQFKVSADRLEGTGFVNYGWIDQHADKTAEPVAVSGIRQASMTNMCQSVVTTLPIVGEITLKLTAGTGDQPVTATDLFIDMAQLQGNADFTNIQIGHDAASLNKGPAGAQGLQGLFGQQADRVVIDDLRQTAWAANAGRFRLHNLRMNVIDGTDECF
jgi:Family of unknown function (DUF6230)